MPELNRDRLVKLLNMTLSSHDGEALSAIRRANELVLASRGTWDGVVSSNIPKDETATVQAAAVHEQEGATFDGVDEPIMQSRQPNSVQVARSRVRSFPLILRVALFPLWLTAEAYITSCVNERWPMKLMALLAPMAVAVMTGVVWFLIVRSLIAAVMGMATQ